MSDEKNCLLSVIGEDVAKQIEPELDLVAANVACDFWCGEAIRLTAERDAALARNDELVAQVEKLRERNRKLDIDLLRALFYAPSSPVSADKAHEIEVWYGKFKTVYLASKGGES